MRIDVGSTLSGIVGLRCARTLCFHCWLLFAVLFSLLAGLTPALAAPPQKTAWALLKQADRDSILQAFAMKLDDYRAGVAKEVKEDDVRSKTLDELLKDLNPTWQKKYAREYADMLLTALTKDPKRFAEIAGELSAGDYRRVEAVAGAAASAVLAKAISGTLEAFNFDQTKTIFDYLIKNASDLQPIGKAFFRGEWGNVIKELRTYGTKAAKEASKEAIAATVGWVFGPLGTVAGQGYVAALEVEISFLKWGERTLDRKATRPCLDLYVQEYQRVNGQGTPEAGAAVHAYDEFKMCSERSFGAFGFRPLEDYFRENNLDGDRILRQMAEDFRLGKFQFVDQWLAQRLEERKLAVENQIVSDLTKAQTEMNAVGARFNRAATEILNNLVNEALGQQTLSELEAEARKALLDAADLLILMRRAHGGALGACTAFAGAKADAKSIVDTGLSIQDQASRVNIQLKNFAGCGAAGAAGGLAPLLERARTLRQWLAQQSQIADSETRNTCQLAESIGVAGSAEAARTQLDNIGVHAGQAARAVIDGRAAAQEIADLARRAQAFAGGDNGASARAELDALLAAADALPRDLPPLETRLSAAIGALSGHLKTARNLEAFAQDQAGRIKPLLAPYKSSPLRGQILGLLEEVDRLLIEIADCRRDIADQYDKGSDDALALRLTKLSTSETDALPINAAAAKAKCPGAGTGPVADPAELQQIAAEADSEATILGLAKGTYERCVAEATVAASNIQSNPPPTANALLTLTSATPDRPIYGPWKTVESGSVVYSLYEGEFNVTGTYTWPSPPASIGPEGFSITLSVQCKTGPKNQMATGIGMSAEGFDLTTSAADPTPIKADAPANCEFGDSKSNSVTVYVKPRKSYSPGEKAKLRIGAFWGLGATYEYVAR